jgi:DNA-binding CsgD family transcriptional regulator
MVEQWSSLALLAGVAAGLVAATIASLLVRSRQTAFFRYFLMQLLLFNLLILGGLAVRYVDLELRQRGVQTHPALLPGLLAALGALKVGWLYAFTAMSLVLPGQEIPPWFSRRLGAGVAVSFVAWVILLAAGLVTRSGETVVGLLAFLEIVVLGGAASACVGLIARARRASAGPRNRALRLLGGVYLTIFAIMIGSLTLGWLRPSGPTQSHLLFNSTFMVLYNLLPLAWIVRFQPTGPIRDAGDLERYGITPREREIIDLICSGRTNQEIADRLFISPATVKDHNYNIFRKTGVRNRVELANLMRGGSERSPSSPTPDTTG